MGLQAAIQSRVRQDGYSQDAAQAVCQFQAVVEGGKYGPCNYTALRQVLSFAKGKNLSFDQLISQYVSIK
jgi:hypothetical protein